MQYEFYWFLFVFYIQLSAILTKENTICKYFTLLKS